MDPLSENSKKSSKDGNIKALMDGSGESSENIGECISEGPEDSSDPEGDMPFEPYDVNGDGRIIKTASQYSRDAWKRPEPEWEVAITVHGFCEISTISTADDISKDEDRSSTKETRVNKVEPSLQLDFKLGRDEHEGFPQGVVDQAKAASVELNPLLHSAIASMVRNERATFSVSCIFADEARVDDGSKPTIYRLEYDISLDAWTEEIDLSDHNDGSLVKRVMRDGDGAVEPTEVGKVTVRCRLTRKCSHPQDLGEETVVFDNLQSQDGSSEKDGAQEEPLTFVLDDCPFGPGVTAIIKSMRTGELCEATLEPEYAPVEYLGDESLQHHAVVELLEVEDLPSVWSTDEVRLDMSKRFKLEGNEKFSAGDFIRALRRYEKAIRYADGVSPGGDYSHEDDGFDDSPSGENERGRREDEVGTDERGPLGGRDVEFVDLQVAILCNQAACHLKLGDGAAALEVADRASTFKAPVDGAAGVKAAYRRACALEAVGDLDEARVAFKSVLDVDPKNSHCVQGLARIARAEKAYQARLRKAFGGCLTSGKLKGFASEGREMSSEARQREEEDGQDLVDARQRHLADAHDGSWTDDSGSSETEENEVVDDDSYDEDLPLLAKGNKGSADVDQSPSVVEDNVLKAADRAPVSEPACKGAGDGLSLSLNPADDSPTGEQEMDEKLTNRSCPRSPQTGEPSNSDGNIEEDAAKFGTKVPPPPPSQA